MDKRKGPMTPEQKAALAARFAAGRAAKKAERESVPHMSGQKTEPSDLSGQLTDDELATIRAKAREKIEAELATRRAAERNALIEETLNAEILQQRRAAGLTDAGDDVIEFMVNVPPFANDVRIDGKVYQHGTFIRKARREYDSMRDNMARGWESEDRAGNPNKKFAHERQMMGTLNPMLLETRMPDGSFTVGAYAPRVHGLTGAISGRRGRE